MRSIALLTGFTLLIASTATAQQDVRKASVAQVPQDVLAQYISAESPVKISDKSRMIVVIDSKHKKICYVIETEGKVIAGNDYAATKWSAATMSSSTSCAPLD